ncbi:MAG: ABC transporter permease [Cyclobacteriaceae bacterium]
MPPKWADKFLRWFCNPALLEDIQGDAYELYDRRLEIYGKVGADRRFIWDVIRFFRWSNVKRSKSKYQTNQIPMFKNYLKVGFRNLRKNWVTSAINVSGLALAVGCAITVFMFIDHQLNMDTFHSNYDRIYQVINHVKQDGDVQKWGDSPFLLGPLMTENHSEVKRMARIEYQSGNVRFADKVFNETVVFTDPDYMRIFDFPLLDGDRFAMDQKEQIVISYNYAVKYFGTEDPVGKRMSVKYSNGVIQSYFVGAVLDEFPVNISFGFNIMAPMQNFLDLKLKENYDWSQFADATFIELHPNQDPTAVASSLRPYIELQNATDSKWPIETFELWPLADLSVRNHEISGAVSGGGHPAGRIALSVIAILLLTLACFNYMNLAVAAATKRLKEIGLRKVLGSARAGIIKQFLIENVVLCLFALILGVVLCYSLLMPGFNMLIPVVIPFAFSSFQVAFLFFAALLLVIGIASGAYPAFYISKFQPVHIFRGSQKFGGKNIFSRILLTFQFIIAFTTVIGSFVFTDNAIYLKERDWGYEKANLLSIPVGENAVYNKLRDKALQNADIESIAGAEGHIARSGRLTTMEHLENQYTAMSYAVGFDYLETMNIRLKNGRFFERSKPSDLTESMIISEALAKKYGFTEPVGETIKYDSVNYRVIGVVEDFFYNDFYSDNHPVFFTMAPEADYKYAAIQAAPGTVMDVDAYLKEAWLEISPNDPYNRLHQNDAFLQFYNDNESNIILISSVSVFAIILSSIGLFGLLTFNITKRLKEFGIRKALGAGKMNIIRLANKEYVWILTLSFIIGAPFGYLLIQQLINEIYTDPQQPGAWPFIIAILIMAITIVITVSGQVLKASRVNPAQILRNE